MNEEWFEFSAYKKSDTEWVFISDELNELSKTHEIIEVHYATYSSSDWGVMSGGSNTALVRARKKEVPK